MSNRFGRSLFRLLLSGLGPAALLALASHPTHAKEPAARPVSTHAPATPSTKAAPGAQPPSKPDKRPEPVASSASKADKRTEPVATAASKTTVDTTKKPAAKGAPVAHAAQAPATGPQAKTSTSAPTVRTGQNSVSGAQAKTSTSVPASATQKSGKPAATATATASSGRAGQKTPFAKPNVTIARKPGSVKGRDASDPCVGFKGKPGTVRLVHGKKYVCPQPRRWQPEVPAGYRQVIYQLHQRSSTPAPRDEQGRPYLVFEVINTGERLEVAPQDDSGHFSAADMDRIAHVLRDTRNHNEHPIDPSLMDLIYTVQLHFQSEAIRVVSAYRTPKPNSGSNHGRGRAIDIIVPGTKDRDAAAFVRAQGFVGVGIYPTSGFIHVDVRPTSYCWEDRSGPGQPNREQAASCGDAAGADARALASGRKRPTPWHQPTEDVDGVWNHGPTANELTSDQHTEDLEEDDLEDEQ